MTMWCEAACALSQGGLVLYSAHRWWLLPRGGSGAPAPAPLAVWPRVTVQLPVYNEPAVVERLVDAVAALDYPADRLEIQLLDDSDDGSSALAGAAVARARARGIDAHHLRRDSRAGYKAGALAAGLARARGEFVAVFDADFVPPPGFLRRTLAHFADPGVGMVQARWGHLNRDRSALTAAQATVLDAHFLLEHAARMRRGLFFNFNGTAGIWRRAAIEDSGGWSADTLTEDLDLSYRAQLHGWRFVFAPGVVAPAELPADMAAFRSQQRRWVTGAIQVARKLLPAVWRAPLALRVKLEATLHLTANVAYPLLLVLGLLLPFALRAPSPLPAPAGWALQAGLLVFGALPVVLFLGAGARAAGVRGPRLVRDVALALVLAAGLALANARAVLAGLLPGRRAFVRTPKTGEGGSAVRAPRGPRRAPRPSGELALAVWFALALALAAAAGQWRALPFLALLAAGHAWVGLAPGSPPRPVRGG